MECMLSMDSTSVGMHQIFMLTSGAYVVDPSVNTLRVPNPIFAICLDFQQTKFTQKLISYTH